MLDSRQQLFQLRSIGADVKKRELRTKARQTKRQAKQEAEKALPRRLGRLRLASVYFIPFSFTVIALMTHTILWY